MFSWHRQDEGARHGGRHAAMKNCFGVTPCTTYGEGSPEKEPGLKPAGGRGPIHSGRRQPSASAPPEVDRKSPREGGYRVPRVVADLAAARPIHLSIVESVESELAADEGKFALVHEDEVVDVYGTYETQSSSCPSL